MKFLVLGVSGMAGSLISIYLSEAGHQVLGFSRRNVDFVSSISGDARDIVKLQEIINTGNFDAVINAIGILNQDAEENKEMAVFLNGYLPHFLAKITENTNTQIIHMSTDCVFSGKKGSYTESEFQDGETFYDRTKIIGELEDGKNLTLRNSIVGPDMNENGIGLLNWFMKQRVSVNGYTRAIWTGMTTLELAKVMEIGAKERAHGIVNMVPDKAISKYDLLCLFNKYFKKSAIRIKPYDNFIIDKSLVRTNYELKYHVQDYEKMVAELSVWVQRHKKYYPHYHL